jgi:hypothetical protein
MSLKEFLDEKTSLVERLDRYIYAGSLLDKITESHTRTGDRKQAIKDRVKPWFDNVIPFGEFVKLSDKELWEQEIKKIYLEQNE